MIVRKAVVICLIKTVWTIIPIARRPRTGRVFEEDAGRLFEFAAGERVSPRAEKTVSTGKSRLAGCLFLLILFFWTSKRKERPTGNDTPRRRCVQTTGSANRLNGSEKRSLEHHCFSFTAPV